MRREIKWQNNIWIDIFKPTSDDLSYLRKNYNFHPLVLEEFISQGHRPQVERYSGYIFMTFNYPSYSKETRETTAIQLNIIATPNVLITSRHQLIFPLESLLHSCSVYEEARKNHMSEGTAQLLFSILSGFWKTSLTKLERIDQKIDDIEKAIFRGREKEMVFEISLVKTDIIDFWRIVEPQEEILESLHKEGVDFFGQKFAPHFSDLLGTYHQVANRLRSFKETILAVENTNQSILSTKTNETIQLLTIFSVILLPLTLLTSVWGMNFNRLPLSNNQIGFWIVIGIMTIIVVSMIFFFRKKGWL